MWFDECPNDDQGLLRPLVTASGRVVVMCDSGGEVWLSPMEIAVEAALYPAPPVWKVVPGVDVVPGTTRWAELEDFPQDWRGLEIHS